MTKDKVKPDSADKVYWRQNETFADLFNAYLYNGEQVIKSEELEELDTDKFLPVITLVLYYGEKDWDGPRSLYDMLVIPERIKHFVGNYPINIIQMKDNDLLFHNQYNVDLFTVMSIVYNTEKTMNQKIEELRQYESDRLIDEKVIDVIVATTNLKVNKKKVGEQKLCTFWDEVMEYGKNEGKNEGLIEGKREAQYEAIHNIMESLNMSMEQAMDVLKIPESERAKYTSKA